MLWEADEKFLSVAQATWPEDWALATGSHADARGYALNQRATARQRMRLRHEGYAALPQGHALDGLAQRVEQLRVEANTILVLLDNLEGRTRK